MERDIINPKSKWRTNLPGRTLSANDQLDKGPVMLRTATQTSSKELNGRQIQLITKTPRQYNYW